MMYIYHLPKERFRHLISSHLIPFASATILLPSASFLETETPILATLISNRTSWSDKNYVLVERSSSSTTRTTSTST